MQSPANNLFDLESPLVERLKLLQSELPELRVGSAITLVGVTNVAGHMPGVFVRPAASPNAEDVGGHVQEWQQWEVICGVRAVAQKQDLSTTYTALGALSHRVLTHLHAWNSPVGMFAYTGRDEVIEHAGYAEVALNFSVPVLVDLANPGTLDDFLRFYPSYAVYDADSHTADHINLPAATEPAP